MDFDAGRLRRSHHVRQSVENQHTVEKSARWTRWEVLLMAVCCSTRHLEIQFLFFAWEGAPSAVDQIRVVIWEVQHLPILVCSYWHWRWHWHSESTAPPCRQRQHTKTCWSGSLSSCQGQETSNACFATKHEKKPPLRSRTSTRQYTTIGVVFG
jgi:hypothetical protein